MYNHNLFLYTYETKDVLLVKQHQSNTYTTNNISFKIYISKQYTINLRNIIIVKMKWILLVKKRKPLLTKRYLKSPCILFSLPLLYIYPNQTKLIHIFLLTYKKDKESYYYILNKTSSWNTNKDIQRNSG